MTEWAAADAGRSHTPRGPTAAPSLDLALVRQVRQRVADRLSERRKEAEAEEHLMDLDDRRALTAELIDDELAALATAQIQAGQAPLDTEVEAELAQAVLDAIHGLGPLQRLLEDTDITDIHANGCDRVWIKRADGTKEQGPPLAASDAELVELIRMAGARLGLGERRFDAASPELDLRLPDNSRLSAVMEVAARPALSIRRHRFLKLTLPDLVGLDAIDQALAGFLAAAVRARKNIVVAGGTGAGKTTMLRALAAEIGPEERLVTIENTLELGLDEDAHLHPDVVALESRLPNTEGQGGISMSQLVRRALRMDPDRVIVGEVLGDEILDLLNAMSQGNDGSLSTIHARSSEGVSRRIASYAIRSAERLPVEATNLLVATAVDFVVFIDQRYEAAGAARHRRRFVSSVREVVGADRELVVSNEVFRPGPGGRAVPAAPMRCLPDLVAEGFDDRLLDRPEGWWSR
ncbi:MAG: Flp pilus assembly complex ATPase component TadA [Actinomycetota bacterium]|nr:Flp pilus assembly complex ATPase component TadA [Actinomycetota bacterium]